MELTSHQKDLTKLWDGQFYQAPSGTAILHDEQAKMYLKSENSHVGLMHLIDNMIGDVRWFKDEDVTFPFVCGGCEAQGQADDYLCSTCRSNL